MSSLGDSVGYLIFGNPISQALLSTAADVIKSTEALLPRKLPAPKATLSAPPPPPVRLPLWELAGRQYNFVRLAGLCGASAVIMGAYGKHIFAKFPNSEDKTESRTVFETANRFHFLHSFALLAMPLVRKPLLTGSLMAVGTILFSGVLYHRALTGDRTYIPVATCGGFCLIVAWLSLIF
ncbi:transmembrane protein 256 homolog [Bactrocera neohumeralis]|uniref:Transmembrane protein 256-like protein n=1 Tax=Bactrocera dorsalis TaxID=27457 RepID=A0A034W263_BACDO|nr:transmembrane protein 256 homolog [Bactrocera tryoni]XP_050340761.1 transmembrane protein 256 homolog [Bactrocera neohumeralis]